MPIPPKTVTNADAGTSDLVGGNDWDDLGTHLANMNKEPYTWYIYKDGSTYKAKNGSTGVIAYSNTDFKTVFDSVIGTIPVRDDTVFTKIKIGPGTFDVNNTIAADGKYNLAIEGSGTGVTRIQAGPSLGAGVTLWSFSGATSGTGKNLTANTTSKSKTATMSSGDASTFAANDWVLVRSTAIFAVGAATAKQGEIKQIASISSGTITFREPLFDTYTTANTSNVIKLLPMRNLSFSNFSLGRHSSYVGSGDPFWWYCRFVDRLSIRNVEVVDFPGQFAGAMHIRSCTNTRISDCHFQLNIPYNFQYGISFSQACQGCVCSNCTSHGDWRHPFEAAVGHSTTDNEGVCRNISFINCTATGGTQAQFDTHPDGENVQFIGCGVLGTNQGGGFKIRSSRSAVIGCSVQNATGTAGESAIRVQDAATFAIIANNQIMNCSTDGIVVQDGLDGPIIQNNYIDNCSGDGIRIETGGAFRPMITGNIISNKDGDGLDVTDIDNAIIVGNQFRANGNYGIRFSASNCQNNVIGDNSFSANVSGTILNGGQTGNREANNLGYP